MKAMNSHKSSSKAESVYLLIGYGVVIGVVTAQIKAGEGTWFTWSVLIAVAYYFLRTLDRLRR